MAANWNHEATTMIAGSYNKVKSHYMYNTMDYNVMQHSQHTCFRFLWRYFTASLQAELLWSYLQPIVICHPNNRALNLMELSRVKHTV